MHIIITSRVIYFKFVCLDMIHIFLFMYAVKSVFCTFRGLVNFLTYRYMESILTYSIEALNGHNTVLEDNVKIFWFDFVVDINFLQLK